MINEPPLPAQPNDHARLPYTPRGFRELEEHWKTRAGEMHDREENTLQDGLFPRYSYFLCKFLIDITFRSPALQTGISYVDIARGSCYRNGRLLLKDTCDYAHNRELGFVDVCFSQSLNTL